MKIQTIPKPICIRKVNENIRLAETGQPLTMSLKALNTFCEFRKKFNEFDLKMRGYRNKPDAERQKKYMRVYTQRPDVKEKLRRYNQRPEVILKRREQQQTPQFKLKKKEWQQKNKERINASARKNYLKNRESKRKYSLEYYYKHREKGKAYQRRKNEILER